MNKKATGGLTEGKSHKEGGIPMKVKSTGQNIEVEGGEGIINKKSMSSTDKKMYKGEMKTNCEIISDINSENNNGVTFDCNKVEGKKYEFSKGGKVSKELNNIGIGIYHEEDGNPMMKKNTFYIWVYKSKNDIKKLSANEYEPVWFPLDFRHRNWEEAPPIKKIWHKSYLKSYKGSENLIGILEGYYNDQTKQITILMMAVKPAFRRKGINGKMVKFAKDFFKVKKENIIFDKPTKSGESFKESGKYSKGGKVKREIWVRFNLGAGKHFGWWQVENKETKEKNYYNPETTQLTLTNCKLTNSPTRAKRIYTGEIYKEAIAYARCEDIKITTKIKPIKSKETVSYNPRKTPNWVNADLENIDNEVFPKVMSYGRQLFVEQNGKFFLLGGNVNTEYYLEGGKIKTPRPYAIRFHLAKGKHFGFWKVDNLKDKTTDYYNPETTQLTMENCVLTNGKKTAGKIFRGEVRKKPVAFVRCEKFEASTNIKPIKTDKPIRYNPKQQPFWVNKALNNIDDEHYNKIISYDRQLFVQKDGKFYMLGGEIKTEYYMKGGKTKSKISDMIEVQQKGNYKDKAQYLKDNPEMLMGQFAKGGDIKIGYYNNLNSIDDIKYIVGEKVWSNFTFNNADYQNERWNKFFKDHNGTVTINIMEDEVEISADSNQDYYDDIGALEVYLKEEIEADLFGNTFDKGGETFDQLSRFLTGGCEIPLQIYNPKNSLGVPRIEMPQIRQEATDEFLEYLESDGVIIIKEKADASCLKPTQKEINIKKVDNMPTSVVDIEPILVSDDNYILDGHHRWYKAVLNDMEMTILKVNIPIKELLQKSYTFDLVEYAELKKGGQINLLQQKLF